ncbi:hypothetical protein I5393_03810 [Citrobacter freundii]|uniref:hypothetical protein n=1 Tax=Citrobacter freundii TaxID=546 RepID=UPI00190024B1|nr:hypothetical protein [Citrobacter freundii]MBJ8767515.1 hypothetical protein [Citrobacter freundii]
MKTKNKIIIALAVVVGVVIAFNVKATPEDKHQTWLDNTSVIEHQQPKEFICKDEHNREFMLSDYGDYFEYNKTDETRIYRSDMMRTLGPKITKGVDMLAARSSEDLKTASGIVTNHMFRHNNLTLSCKFK